MGNKITNKGYNNLISLLITVFIRNTQYEFNLILDFYYLNDIRDTNLVI